MNLHRSWPINGAGAGKAVRTMGMDFGVAVVGDLVATVELQGSVDNGASFSSLADVLPGAAMRHLSFPVTHIRCCCTEYESGFGVLHVAEHVAVAPPGSMLT